MAPSISAQKDDQNFKTMSIIFYFEVYPIILQKIDDFKLCHRLDAIVVLDRRALRALLH